MNEKTTVTIDLSTASKIDKLSRQNNMTKKDFIRATMDYIERNGINPLEHESPSKEMNKLIKRIDQIVGFMRTQEKEILRPVYEAILSSEERIKFSLDNMLSKQDIKPISDKLQFILSDLSENKKTLNISKLSQEEGLKLLAKLIDAKGKTTILTDLTKAYNQDEC